MSKHLGILTLILFGLALIEWSCNNEETIEPKSNCGTVDYRIVEQDSVSLIHYDGSDFHRIEDSAIDVSSIVLYRCHFQIAPVPTARHGSTMLYALSPGVCSYRLVHKLDSIHVYRHDLNLDITRTFLVDIGTPPQLSGNNYYAASKLHSLVFFNQLKGMEIRYLDQKPDKIDLAIGHYGTEIHPDIDRNESFQIRFEFYFDDGSQYSFLTPSLVFK